MNNSMISSATSMNGMQQRLDIIADNIANLSTVGYKSKTATFEDTLTRVQQQANGMNQNGRSTPLGFNLGYGSRLSAVALNFDQGSVSDTDIPTDFAIQGNALFAVQANGTTAWTRQGSFHIQPDPANKEMAYLTTAQGYRVLADNNAPIVVPAGATFHVDAQGNMTATLGENTTQLGKMKLVTPLRTEALEAKADNLFVLAAGVNENEVIVRAGEEVTVRQGALEQSNVDLTEQITEMMQVQRAYQLAARALTSSDTMAGLATSLRR